jgi:hypothetical protein
MTLVAMANQYRTNSFLEKLDVPPGYFVAGRIRMRGENHSDQ